MNQKQKAYSLISKLLQYPELEWKQWFEEVNLAQEFQEQSVRLLFQKFGDYVKKTSFDELCSNYVYTFDFYERTTLYLTFTVFKDNRDRGSVLVQLRQQMMELGMEFTSEELPDYLPLVLEFAAITPEKDAKKIVDLHLRSIRNLALELEGINSPYRFLLDLCIHCIETSTENEKVS